MTIVPRREPAPVRPSVSGTVTACQASCCVLSVLPSGVGGSSVVVPILQVWTHNHRCETTYLKPLKSDWWRQEVEPKSAWLRSLLLTPPDFLPGDLEETPLILNDGWEGLYEELIFFFSKWRVILASNLSFQEPPESLKIPIQYLVNSSHLISLLDMILTCFLSYLSSNWEFWSVEITSPYG